MICYLLMGWTIIFKVNLLPQKLGLGGGIIYTIGAILYGLGKKHKYIHSLFHIAIFIGSLLHFLCILLYVV